jgi:6-phospho-beta-glucosidase
MFADRYGASLRADGAPAIVAVLGGSSAFMPALARALADRARDLPRLEIRLHGRNYGRTQIIADFCRRYATARDVDHRYRAARSIEDAATDAALAVNVIRAGGFAGRLHDESFPLEFGLPGDETIGPGGLASALRAVPVVLDAAERVRRTAPGAVFINMSNPMGILLAALGGIDGLETFGLCELPQVTLERALAILEAPAGELEIEYAGLNHQGFFTRIAASGRDLLPEVFDAIERRGAADFFKIDVEVMRRIGALPLPYLRLLFHTDREVAAQRARPSRAAELARLARRLEARYVADRAGTLPEELEQRSTPWFERALVPALVELLGRRKGEEIYVSERNGAHIGDLPPGAIVEKRKVGGVARAVACVPPAVRDLLARLAEFERLAAAAAVDPSTGAVIAALRAHPLDIGGDRAGRLAPLILRGAAPAEAGA